MSATLSSSTDPFLNEDGTYQLTFGETSLATIEIFPPTGFRYLTSDEETRLLTLLSDENTLKASKVSEMSKEIFTELFDLYIRAYAAYNIYKTSDSKRFFVNYNAPDNAVDSIKIAITSMIMSSCHYGIIYDNIIAKEKSGVTVSMYREILASILVLSAGVSLKIATTNIIDDTLISRYGTLFNTTGNVITIPSSCGGGSKTGMYVGLLLVLAIGAGGAYMYSKKKKNNVSA
jgi:hypothetical protein